MNQNLVKCSYCDMPGTFYIWKQDKILKVTDPMIRLTTKRSATAMYAHAQCRKTDVGL